jgi:hypothetical protein
MVRLGSPLLVLTTIAALGVCTLLPAQDAAVPQAATTGKVRVVPPPKQPQPFSPNARAADLSIEFRPADQMSAKDKLLAADAESSIAEHAGVNGFDLENGQWVYEQIVCPALPNHLFLQYKRNNGVGDVTVFSASIPRGNEGRVRIVPILKRGYSLFSPAPINALTISAFNHIRDEEQEDANQSWLGNGLCYAALAGAHPEVAAPDEVPDLNKPIPTMTAILAVRNSEGEVIHFADKSAKPRPMEWSMTFTRKGRLVKATHVPAELEKEKLVPATTASTPERPVPHS